MQIPVPYSQQSSLIQNLYPPKKLLASTTPSSLSPNPPQKKKKELTRQKLLETQRNIPIPIPIIPLKHVRHALQADAALHEKVEAHAIRAAAVVDAVHHGDEAGREAVAEGDEGLGVLVVGDGAASVFVEAVEEGAPGGEEGPEAAVLWGGRVSVGVFFGEF